MGTNHTSWAEDLVKDSSEKTQQDAEKAKQEDKIESKAQNTEFQELLAELQDKSPTEIFKRANAAFTDQEYTTAVQTYHILNSLYPFSEYAENSKLYCIRAHYRNDAMDEMIKESDQFMQLYPTSEYLEGVAYSRAKAYFKRARGSSRLWSISKYLPFLKINLSERSDTQQLAETAQEFSAFLHRFPNSPYREKAKKKLNKLNSLIVQKECRIAHFYFKRKNYLAVYNRIVSLLEQYPDARDFLNQQDAHTLYKEYQYAKKQLGLTL